MSPGTLLKLHKWWGSHYGTMMAFIYVTVAMAPEPPGLAAFLAALGFFTLASLGIGSFGQLLNDLADVRQDLRSGTQNLVATRGIAARVGLFAATLAVGLVPWRWLPTTPAIVALLVAEYALFALYSLPPVRLKARGILGPVTDALYGYVVPNAVAVLLFARLAGVEMPVWLFGAIVAWCFFFGLRQILQHQLLDEARDRADGIATFAVVRGWPAAFRFTAGVALPLEAAAFVALLVALVPVAPLVPVAFLVHLAIVARGRSRGSVRPGRPSPVDRHHLVADAVMSTFAWRWLPLLGLATLVFRRPEFLPLVPLHVLLFPDPFLRAARSGREALRRFATD